MPAAIGFRRTLARLGRTPNQSAAELLVEGIEGPSAAIRRGAIAALAQRGDSPSQQRFLALFPQLQPEELAHLAMYELPRKFRATLRRALAGRDSELMNAACQMLIACRGFDEFPALVDAAADPGHPGGDALAAATLQLAGLLHDEIVAYRADPSGRDPSFARRWALTALVRAVDRFGEHHRRDLVESLLLVITPENPTLARLLTDQEHPCHQTLRQILRNSRQTVVIELLAALFDDAETPLPLLELAAERRDPEFCAPFLLALGHPASPRTLNNARCVRRLQWLERPAAEWLDMPAEAQATAAQLVVAARLSRRTKLGVLDQLLAHGEPLARRAACASLATIDLPEATARLDQLLADADPQVVATAAKALRRRGHTSAVPHLAQLLDHDDESVRQSAQSALRDFHFMRYLAEFDELEHEARCELGPIVAKSDPAALGQLTAELKAATLSRKCRGLQMTAAMGVVDQVLDELLRLAEHPDAAVRSEAVAVLAASTHVAAREAIAAATGDPNAIVSRRAAAALIQFDAAAIERQERAGGSS